MIRKITSYIIIAAFIAFNISPVYAGHAIELTNEELDEIHAGGLNFNFDNFLGSTGNTASNMTNGNIANSQIGGGQGIIVTPNGSVQILSTGTNPAASLINNSEASKPGGVSPSTTEVIQMPSPTATTAPLPVHTAAPASTTQPTPSNATMLNPAAVMADITNSSSTPGPVIINNPVPNPSMVTAGGGLSFPTNTSSGVVSISPSDPSGLPQTAFIPNSNPTGNSNSPSPTITLAALNPGSTSTPGAQNASNPVNPSPTPSGTPNSSNPVTAITPNTQSSPAPVNSTPGAATQSQQPAPSTNSTSGGSQSIAQPAALPVPGVSNSPTPIQFDILAGNNGGAQIVVTNPNPTESIPNPTGNIQTDPTGTVPLPDTNQLTQDINSIAGTSNFAFPGTGGYNSVNIGGASQQKLTALVNVNAAGSIVPVMINLTVIINSEISNFSNLNDLNISNLTSFQFR